MTKLTQTLNRNLTFTLRNEVGRKKFVHENEMTNR